MSQRNTHYLLKALQTLIRAVAVTTAFSMLVIIPQIILNILGVPITI